MTDEPYEVVHDLCARLGIPGLVDVHTHFLPPRVTEKVRAAFAAGGALIGWDWPIRYLSSDEDNIAVLRAYGVQRFSALPYPHKPGMAEFLNDWAADFADRVPEALRCMTLYPEPDAAAYVGARLADTARPVELVKVHVQVGSFDVRDDHLDAVWGQLAEAGTPVVLHAGSGPVPTAFTGPGPVAEVLRRHPRLAFVMAHAGAPEYAEFLAMAETHEHVRLDTTMAFTDFFTEHGGAYPTALLPRLRDLGLAGKVLLGTDFPHIPYPYAHQLEALERLGLGDDWLRAVCWETGAELFGVRPGAPCAVRPGRGGG